MGPTWDRTNARRACRGRHLRKALHGQRNNREHSDPSNRGGPICARKRLAEMKGVAKPLGQRRDWTRLSAVARMDLAHRSPARWRR